MHMSFSKQKWRLSTIQVVQYQESLFVFCIQFNGDIYLHEVFKNTYLTALIQKWEVKEKAPAFWIGTVHSFWPFAMVFSLNLQYYSLLKESFFLKKRPLENFNHIVVLVVKSCLTLATPLTIACQALLSMGFPRQEY